MSDESPWDYLGLDAETATKKDAKRAYARLLKQTRPDEKPTEFQKLREAYDLVNQWIENREWVAKFESEGNPNEDSEENTVVAFPVSELQSKPEADDAKNTEEEVPLQATSIPHGPSQIPELEEIFQRLQKTATLTAEDRFDEIFKEGIRFTHDLPECLEDWSDRVASLCKDRPERIARNITRKDVVFELENDSRTQSDFLLQHLLDEGNYYELGLLANHLREDGKRLTNPVAANFLVDLADAIGFVQPNRGTSLLDLAYPHLSPGFRDYAVNRVEFRVNRGKLFSGAFAEKRREFWDARIRESEHGRDYDWWCDEAREEIGALHGAMLTQPILNELETVIPGEIFERVKKSSIQQPIREATNEPLSPAIILIRFGVLFLGVFIISIFLLTNDSEEPEPIAQPGAQLGDYMGFADQYDPKKFEEMLNNGVPSDPEPLLIKDDDLVSAAFYKNSVRIGTNGLIKVAARFIPESLEKPLNEVAPGSSDHLALLEHAALSPALPEEHRKEIPALIRKLFPSDQAQPALSRLQETTREKEMKNQIEAILRSLAREAAKESKNSLNPALPAPQ